MSRRMAAVLLAAFCLLVTVLVEAGPARATPAKPAGIHTNSSPRLEVPVDYYACRGVSVSIDGVGFTPGQSYQFATTVGSMRYTTVVAKDDGTLLAVVDVPADPGTARGMVVSAAAADAPSVTVASVSIGGFGSTAVEVPFGPSVDPSLPIYSAGSQLELIGSCFQSGEAIELSSPQVSFSTAHVSEGSGIFDIKANVLDVHSTGMAMVTATGVTSGHSASLLITTGGAVLDAGTELNATGFGQLVSPSGHYRLRMYDSGIYVCRFPQAYSCDQTWSPVTTAGSQQDSTVLQLRTDGNLVLLDGGRPIWSTGTAGAGNQLAMRDDGNLALTDAQHHLLWSSNTGLVRGAAGYVSSAYIAASRQGSAVYVNGLVKQWNQAAQLVRGAHRLVYLQRMVGGSWQNMLSRTTDAAGQLAVGFVQSKAYNYRLLAVAAGGAAGAYSATVAR